MMKLRLLLIMVSMILVVSTTYAQNMIQVAQWASRAEATSEYSDPNWAASQATGEPDVLECEDNANSWASATVTDEEVLTVYFRKAVEPTQLNIYQNYNPGAIIAIEVIPSDGSDPIRIRNSADPGSACPGVFSIDLPGGLPMTNAVNIILDQTIVNNWNEIDAVELVGMIEGDNSDAVESSLENGAFGLEVTSNSGNSSSNTRGPSSNNNNNNSSSSLGDGSSDFDGEWGRTFRCNDGTQILNGIELTIIQQRTGNNYSVTVVGLDGFDPVLAVTDPNGNHLCNDDSADAATYSANLPTTGQVSEASLNSQVIFANNGSGNFQDISLLVGGYGGTGGEFLVIVEGMYASRADGAGDPFSLYVSPALLVGGVNPTAYMISVVNGFDPMLFLIDADYNYIEDEDGSTILCDDAGNASLCWGESEDLSDSYVSRSRNRQLGGGPLDAMLQVQLGDTWGGYYNFVMAGNNSEGDYVAVFHMSTAQDADADN